MGCSHCEESFKETNPHDSAAELRSVTSGQCVEFVIWERLSRGGRDDGQVLEEAVRVSAEVVSS